MFERFITKCSPVKWLKIELYILGKDRGIQMKEKNYYKLADGDEDLANMYRRLDEIHKEEIKERKIRRRFMIQILKTKGVFAFLKVLIKIHKQKEIEKIIKKFSC